MALNKYEKEHLRQIRELKKFANQISKIAQAFLKMAEAAKMVKDAK